jgi:hypothetical protein
VRVEGVDGLSARIELPEPAQYQGAALPEPEIGADGTNEGQALPPLPVHAGAVEGRIVFAASPLGFAGEPRVVVRYQVCSDAACYRPMEVELALRLASVEASQG